MPASILASLAVYFGPFDTPFIVPVAGCAMILGIVVAGIWSGIRTREMQSAERLAAIARGVPVMPAIAEEAAPSPIYGAAEARAQTVRRRGNVRRGGLVLVGVGLGMIAFFTLLTWIVREREVLAAAAAGLIPLGIGVALLVDARIQSREIEQAAQQGPGGRELSL